MSRCTFVVALFAIATAVDARTHKKLTQIDTHSSIDVRKSATANATTTRIQPKLSLLSNPHAQLMETNMKSLPAGEGWNIYFRNAANTNRHAYVFQKPDAETTLSTVGYPWRVIDLLPHVDQYGPFVLPASFSCDMIDQDSAYDDPRTDLELRNAPGSPPRATKVYTHDNTIDPVSPGMTLEYDQNWERSFATDSYLPAFVTTEAESDLPGMVTVRHNATFVPGTSMKNQRTTLRITKNGFPLFQTLPIQKLGAPPFLYVGGMSPGSMGYIAVAEKLHIGLTFGEPIKQGQYYSYETLEGGESMVEYTLPSLDVDEGSPTQNNLLVTISADFPPTIAVYPFNPMPQASIQDAA